MVHYTKSENGPSIVLAAGIRTPWVRAGGLFRGEDAAHLGAQVARELIARTNLDPSTIDEVVAGCVGNPFNQANVGRVLALRAGIPQSVPARTVARNCASGIEAVTSAITHIQAGLGDTYLCVGVEHMSAYPLTFGKKMTGFFERMMKARSPFAKLSTLASFRPSWLAPTITLVEGLTDPTTGLIMGKTAELLARDFGITRADADQFACESHNRAQAARDKGRFKREILPMVPLGSKKGRVEHDDSIRDGQSVEKLSKMRPYFEKPDGVVTIGNACGITDGAAALLVCTEERAKELGLTPLAKFRSWAWEGCDPERMGIGPVHSSATALDSAGCELKDMGVVELNEAFATQVLACQRAFNSTEYAKKKLGRNKAIGQLDIAKTNPNGGAIALGHPVGATGARLLLTTAHELQAGNHELGLATLCIGGGQGGSVVLERMS
ncbi:MAG: thiolase family protein [Planctomycetota bacterium]|jgi:acetyl-CoA C-acetyltransferase/acetyl-CoA acyltransferase|nr:thiolase family protein [Planctomycetota bacterium]MDP6940648.1 thiolase family protein [Planctomycetota bacterium]